jgi:hypothetical protein
VSFVGEPRKEESILHPHPGTHWIYLELQFPYPPYPSAEIRVQNIKFTFTSFYFVRIFWLFLNHNPSMEFPQEMELP